MARVCRLRDLSADAFASICATSESLAEVIRRIGLTLASTAYRDVKRRARRENVSLEHLPQGLGANAGRPSRNRTSIDKIFASGVRQWIKIAIRRDGLLPYKCAICAMDPFWNGKSLTLRLDHINGDPSDNSLINLRFVCPNCDSQLPTFAGRNRKNKTTCIDCRQKITPGCTRCARCQKRRQPTKISWPLDLELLEEVKRTGYRATANRLGVSDKAVKKRLAKRLSAPNFRGPDRIRLQVAAQE